MKNVIRAIAAACLIGAAHAGEQDLGCGTINVPDGFEFRRLRGIDSFVAEITRTNDGFSIHCDVGKMAGHQIGPPRKGYDGGYDWIRLHRVCETMACTGIKRTATGGRIVATVSSLFSVEKLRAAKEENASAAELERLREKMDRILERHKSAEDEPANFSAEFRDETDIAEFMLIVGTYRAREKAPSNQPFQDSVVPPHPER